MFLFRYEEKMAARAATLALFYGNPVCDKGTALMYQNEQSYIVNEGDLIVFLPSVVHSVHAVSDAPLQYYVLKFDLSQLDSSASLTGGSWNYSALFNNAINNEQADILFPGGDTPLSSGTVFI